MSGRYLDTFREEAGELLQELEAALLVLEETQESAESIDLIFRILHTLKGSGAMAGFNHTAALAHDVETLFELVRNGRVAVDRELISATLAALDLLRATVAAELAGEHPEMAAVAALNERLRALLPAAEVAADAAMSVDAAPDGEEELFFLRFRPSADLFLRGIEPVSLLLALEELGTLACVARQQAIPALGRLDPESCFVFWDLLLVTRAGIDAVRDVFIFVEGDSEVVVRPLALNEGLEPGRALELAAVQLAEAGDLPPESVYTLLVERFAAGNLAAVERGPRRDNDSGRSGQEQGTSIRVRSERLDHLVNLIGELVTIQARLSQTVNGRKDAALEALTEEIERLTWGLRDEVLYIRMLPIGATFGRLRRLVRDLGNQLGKEVEFVTSGDETELDKTVIERLHDPLMHLLRNCLDHGIERPEERIAGGKPSRGTVMVSAAHSGAYVVLTVSDDGRGLDRERLLRRALELGLVESERGASEREVQQLIFAPGFSTAREVTSISGRGVGMDAVRRAIEGLRGSIEVSSTPGRGTTFAIKLPLTLAIIDGLLVKVGSEQYIVPLGMVEECVELTRQNLALGSDRQLLSLRGELVPFLRLREEFVIGGPRPKIEQVVVTNCDGQRIGLVVDKVIGSHQTVIKPMGRLLQESRGFSGATILGSGQVALILDVPWLIDSQGQEFQPTGT